MNNINQKEKRSSDKDSFGSELQKATKGEPIYLEADQYIENIRAFERKLKAFDAWSFVGSIVFAVGAIVLSFFFDGAIRSSDIEAIPREYIITGLSIVTISIMLIIAFYYVRLTYQRRRRIKKELIEKIYIKDAPFIKRLQGTVETLLKEKLPHDV